MASYGSIETQVRHDVLTYGELLGVAPSLAEAAYALARVLDNGAGLATAAVARELRATLLALADGGKPDDDTAAVLAGLGSPVGTDVPTPVGDAKDVEQADARPTRRRGRKAAGASTDAVATARRGRRAGA